MTLDESTSAYVTGVTEDGPAKKAGIETFDQIMAVDNQGVTSADQCLKLMRSQNTSISIDVLRDEKMLHFAYAIDPGAENTSGVVINSPQELTTSKVHKLAFCPAYSTTRDAIDSNSGGEKAADLLKAGGAVVIDLNAKIVPGETISVPTKIPGMILKLCKIHLLNGKVTSLSSQPVQRDWWISASYVKVIGESKP